MNNSMMKAVLTAKKIQAQFKLRVTILQEYKTKEFVLRVEGEIPPNTPSSVDGFKLVGASHV